MTSLQSFSCFPRLPTELRLKIWKAALTGPHIYHITHNATTDTFLVSSPAISRASSESREACLELFAHHKRLNDAAAAPPPTPIGARLPPKYQPVINFAHIVPSLKFFDPKLDVLFFDCNVKRIYDFMLANIPSHVRARISCLAVDQTEVTSGVFWSGGCLSDLCKHFGGLEELVLVKRSRDAEARSAPSGSLYADAMRRCDVEFVDMGLGLKTGPKGVGSLEFGMGGLSLLGAEDSGYESEEDAMGLREVYEGGRKKLLREFKNAHEWWDAPWMEPYVTVMELRGGAHRR
jgi:hypothetical protein